MALNPESLIRAVTLIPASGEFVYATVPYTSDGGARRENTFAQPPRADVLVALDQLDRVLPNCSTVALVVSWFGTDVRVGDCEIFPGVESRDRSTSPTEWMVAGEDRASAYLVSQTDGGPTYGGTPDDASVKALIAELKARGKRIVFYPFILMDVPPGNVLPNPYSDNAATIGQAVFPWRGRITCSPAAGYVGTVDKTSAAATQVDSFFDREWGLRRFVTHYAQLCVEAGGVDAFLIGSEMVGLTIIRSSSSVYPAAAKFQALAAETRAIVGPDCQIGYTADWSEYHSHRPDDGTGDVYFNLDPVFADPNIDFVGIDNYTPIADHRPGDVQSIYDLDYLKSNIEGGEGYDYFYASYSDRVARIETPITDFYGEPWVFRQKDFRNWWDNLHYNRPAGVPDGFPTAWMPGLKPIWFTEFGCPSVDEGPNQPNVFFDPKSSESFLPYFSLGIQDVAVQRAYLTATLEYWRDNGGAMVSTDNMFVWTWDARPYPTWPDRTDIWNDGGNYRFGHWITGRMSPEGVYNVTLLNPLPVRITDDNGRPIPGGLAFFYESGTTTLAPVYADDALTTPRTNPVVADNAGLLPPIYRDDTILYRVLYTDASGDTASPIFEADGDGGAARPRKPIDVETGISYAVTVGDAGRIKRRFYTGDMTDTLPAPGTMGNGGYVTIWNTSAYTDTVSVSGGALINNEATLVLQSNQRVEFISTGTAYLADVPPLTTGQRMVSLPAGFWSPRPINGAVYDVIDLTTNNIGMAVYKFDATTEEAICGRYRMPNSWDGGPIEASFSWGAEASTVGQTVTFGIRARVIEDGEPVDLAYGTAAEISWAAGASTPGEMITTFITFTPAAAVSPLGDRLMLYMEVYRKGATGTIAGDVYLTEVTLRVVLNRETDA